MTLKLPDDLADRLSDLQKRSDTLVKKALEEGGKVVLKQAQSNLNSVVGKGTKYDSRATGELERSLGLSPVKGNGRRAGYQGRLFRAAFRRRQQRHAGGAFGIRQARTGGKTLYDPSKTLRAKALHRSNAKNL